jgi:hypothetical protein
MGTLAREVTAKYKAEHKAEIAADIREGMAAEENDVVWKGLLARRLVDRRTSGVHPKNFINLAGQRFGKYLVVAQTGHNEANAARWTCLCECGQVTVVAGQDLRRGKATRCKKCSSARIDISGTTVGELSVGLWTAGTNVRQGRYAVTCSCGTLVALTPKQLKTMTACQGCRAAARRTARAAAKMPQTGCAASSASDAAESTESTLRRNHNVTDHDLDFTNEELRHV